MATIRYIAVHHTGGTINPLESTQHLLATNVDAIHKARWNFRSSLGYYGGYNFFIDGVGITTQFRRVGEETAAQFGHNLDTVSICLAGNFSRGVDKPTPSQEAALAVLIDEIFASQTRPWSGNVLLSPTAKLELDASRIVPHRLLGQTECYGGFLKDDWARKIYQTSMGVSSASQILSALRALLARVFAKPKTTLASDNDRGCDGFTH